jgi:phage terminase large subunit-like protein
MGKSIMQEIAELSPAEQVKALDGLDPEALLWDWTVWRRPEQVVPPAEESALHAYLAGRGAGKTRTAAETVREWARTPNTRIALVARTSADNRDVQIEGESGLMNVHPPSELPTFEPSKRRVTWPNGSVATAFSSESPDSLRGPQFHRAWGDELAAWKWIPGVDGLTAWDNLQIATRLGTNPQILVTTTPKRVQAVRDILNDAQNPDKRVTISRGSTKDNAGNLSSAYLEVIYGLYAGTRLGAQELEGVLLDDVEGALWSQEMIPYVPANFDTSQLPLRVVGVDPSVAESPRDECGIVVVGATRERKLFERHAYVLDDASIHGSPDVWAKQVVAAAKKWNAPVIAEVNQGGELVKMALRGVDPTVQVYTVHSKQGKALRAEPIVLAYEQHRVHHVDVHAMLEAQMTSWVPEETRKSPDRVDALVHGLTALLTNPPKGLRAANGVGARRIKAARGQIAGVKDYGVQRQR